MAQQVGDSAKVKQTFTHNTGDVHGDKPFLILKILILGH